LFLNNFRDGTIGWGDSDDREVDGKLWEGVIKPFFTTFDSVDTKGYISKREGGAKGLLMMPFLRSGISSSEERWEEIKRDGIEDTFVKMG